MEQSRLLARQRYRKFSRTRQTNCNNNNNITTTTSRQRPEPKHTTQRTHTHTPRKQRTREHFVFLSRSLSSPPISRRPPCHQLIFICAKDATRIASPTFPPCLSSPKLYLANLSRHFRHLLLLHLSSFIPSCRQFSGVNK